MGIFTRFADIVNANINALLDKAEDPEKMIRLIIQEMEDTLVEVRTTSARTIAEKKELARRIEHAQKDAEDWEQKAELAISKEREDLAKAALQERNTSASLAESLQKQMIDLEDTLEKLSVEVTQLQEKIADAKSRQKALIMRHKTASSRVKVKQHLANNSIEDALARFDAYERKLDDIEAHAESYDLGRKKSLADEIADLENQESLDAQLKELKNKVKKGAK